MSAAYINGGNVMSRLTVDQKTIKDLLQDKNADFLIPDYQRPYAWEEKECRTLWDDIFSFAIPDDGRTEFDRNSEYFLGPIVTFENDKKMEVIDGQQRLTTLMLLLRAFYEGFGSMQDDATISSKQDIEKCLWKTNEIGKPDKDKLKINSEVATDNVKNEFLEILRTGTVKSNQKSRYALNYKLFQDLIADFKSKYPKYFPYLPIRIMNNCILLPIEAESQDTALRIFSTLNDRGKPLSDADIFKAQFYKHYSCIGERETFISKWRDLEELCEKVFHPSAGTGTPMDELFTRYMYYVRAKMGNKSSTLEALRKFYEKANYEKETNEKKSYLLLKNSQTFDDLIILAHFWEDVSNQDKDRFSAKVLRRLFVLNYAPNSMWTYIVSVYFMHNKDQNGLLNDNDFCEFLDKITGFIWTYAVTNPGVYALRTPIFAEMVNIVNDCPVTFGDYKFSSDSVNISFINYKFSNGRPITKSMLAWWAFQDDEQELLSLETVFEVEHIYARNRQENEASLNNISNLEALGNKSLLEKRINIRASDYRFEDKIKYYQGKRSQKKDGTKINELIKLSNEASDFTEADIEARSRHIMDSFLSYLKANKLLLK